ncbi:Uncharacterised protein [Legionella beliardensis]|uniref:Opacity protein and related surface antigens n=1 Tax=Legionella beliardensis TaxID=91822 RepID=A0A378I8X6_9GAMM|nr:hypothetical protein [Legionella beliardensis]STX28824.1 Uncharacterised protein [Legionella beliardensis]
MKKLFFFIFIAPSCLYANPLNFFVAGGATAARLKNETALAINNLVTNNYHTSRESHWQGFWGGGFNQTFSGFLNNVSLSLGLAGYSLSLGKVQGIEYPFVNEGLFDTLNYRFQVENKLLLVESYLAYSAWNNWQPFLLAGIGKAWNHLYNYQEYPTHPASSAATSQLFNDNKHQDFSYELGLGLQYHLLADKSRKMNYSASLGYRYFNLGEGKLGLSNQAATTLKVRNLYAQSIIFAIHISFTES